jgi:hypothetical protein
MSTPLTSEQQQALGQPFVRQQLRDLPTPPEVAEAAQRFRKRLGWEWRPLRAIEDELKLQYYYGGQEIRCLFGKDGPIIVAIYRGDDEDYRNQLQALSAQEKQEAVVLVPSVFNDPNAEIIGFYSS